MFAFLEIVTGATAVLPLVSGVIKVVDRLSGALWLSDGQRIKLRGHTTGDGAHPKPPIRLMAPTLLGRAELLP